MYDLSDGEILESIFFEQKNTLVIKIAEWNNNTIEIRFTDTIAFNRTTGDFLACLKEVQGDDPFLNSAINKIYEKRPDAVPYKAFSFFDIYDTAFFTIIAKEYTVSPAE